MLESYKVLSRLTVVAKVLISIHAVTFKSAEQQRSNTPQRLTGLQEAQHYIIILKRKTNKDSRWAESRS